MLREEEQSQSCDIQMFDFQQQQRITGIKKKVSSI